MRPLRTPAALFSVAEAETEFGGRTASFEPVGALWIAVQRSHRSERSGGDEPPVERLKVLAETRTDPRVDVGMRVEFEGAGWRLAHVARDAPRMGRMTLTLERET